MQKVNDLGYIGGTLVTELMLAKDHMLTRKTIIRNNWQNFSTDLIDKALEALEEAGMIKQHVVRYDIHPAPVDPVKTRQPAAGIYYQVTEQCLKMMQ